MRPGQPLASRAAWFHAPHDAGVLTARACEDRYAWREYAAWHQSAAGPADMTPAQCQAAIASRLAASGPLSARQALTRLQALGVPDRDAQRMLAGSRRHPGLPSRRRGAGLEVAVSYRGRRYHVATRPG